MSFSLNNKIAVRWFSGSEPKASSTLDVNSSRNRRSGAEVFFRSSNCCPNDSSSGFSAASSDCAGCLDLLRISLRQRFRAIVKSHVENFASTRYRSADLNTCTKRFAPGLRPRWSPATSDTPDSSPAAYTSPPATRTQRRPLASPAPSIPHLDPSRLPLLS